MYQKKGTKYILSQLSLAGIAVLFKTVDDLASASSSSLLERLNGNPPNVDAIQREFRAHGMAFDQGLIPCQRLVEIFLTPFLKLARKAIQLQGTSAQGLLDEYIACCFEYAAKIITGDLVLDRQGVGKFQPVLQPHKRTELVKGLLKAKFPEVCYQ